MLQTMKIKEEEKVQHVWAQTNSKFIKSRFVLDEQQAKKERIRGLTDRKTLKVLQQQQEVNEEYEQKVLEMAAYEMKKQKQI